MFYILILPRRLIDLIKLMFSKKSRWLFFITLQQHFFNIFIHHYAFVSYNGFNSPYYTASSSVPQPRIVIIFSIYTIDLLVGPWFIHDLNIVVDCRKLFFADEPKIFSSNSTKEDCPWIITIFLLPHFNYIFSCLPLLRVLLFNIWK